MGKQVDKYLKLRKKRSEKMGKDISINPDGQTAITEEVSVKEQMKSMKPEKQDNNKMLLILLKQMHTNDFLKFVGVFIKR